VTLRPAPSSVSFLRRASFQALLDALHGQGYRVLGPTVRDGAVMWDEVRREAELPRGWQDTQEPGRYRLERTESTRLFGVVHGPDSLKRFVFAPREPLLVLERSAAGWTSRPQQPTPDKVAVIGARACDLAGLAIQDRIFLRDAVADPCYRARRAALFTVAVHCTRALPTCLCASTDTGPRARSGFDLALTEQDDGFLVEAGSPAGEAVVARMPLEPATAAQQEAALAATEACARSQSRRLERAGLPRALYDAHDHPRWDDVAGRCLACTNCTMVCPTCFCYTIEEVPDLARQRTERTRAWDSCFTPDHGYIHGKNLRPTVKDRYRMWLTHKVAAWIDQFGMSGCVGCGRCITWCPVGIDLTEEVRALTAPPAAERATG
jgi:sulfhydrogenase subunit beta (sulfur reductase)